MDDDWKDRVAEELARQILERKLREDRERLAYFIENIADQGFEVLRGEDGSWHVVT